MQLRLRICAVLVNVGHKQLAAAAGLSSIMGLASGAACMRPLLSQTPADVTCSCTAQAQADALAPGPWVNMLLLAAAQ